MIHRFFLVSILLVLAGPTAAWSQQAHTVMESEPNDTPASANPAALADILTGSISSNSDVDFFVLDIPAGTLVLMATLLQVCFFDQDGITRLTCNSGEYNQVGYPFTKSGRYYIRLRHGTPETGVTPMGPYQMVVPAESFSLEAGDPARRLVDLPEIDFHGLYPNYEIWRMAAGLAGELYVTVVNGVLRISPTGDTTTLASDLHVIGDVAVDAFGDVVVAGWRDSPFGLWKISPAGELSQYRTDVVFSQFDVPSLAVGPDGDLWVGTNAGITRLDPNGVKKAEIALTAAYHLAVGPSGELYVTGAPGPCEWGAYVVRGLAVECTLPNLTEMVGHATPELAIDQEGALYVGQHEEFGWGYGPRGHVDVLPTGSKTSHQYAHVPWLRALTFGRDTQGNTTSRLFAIQGGVPPWVVELNGANDRAVGAGFNVRFFHATLDPVPTASVGTAYNQALHVITDATALTWTLADGALPPGLTLSASGALQGTPTTTGSFAFSVRATSGVRSWFAPGTIRVIADVSVAEVSAALLGGPQLDPAKIEFLDQLGNRNGILDVGDLRAFLRSRGQLTPH